MINLSIRFSPLLLVVHCIQFQLNNHRNITVNRIHCLIAIPCDPDTGSAVHSAVCNMNGYISILLLIAVASTCHGSLNDPYGDDIEGSGIREIRRNSCRNRCLTECARTWDNGRKSCCEGQGDPNGGVWTEGCNNGRCAFPG